MKRCKALGFPGFEIGSHINDWNLDDKNLDPVYKAAEELDLCLFIHPWDMPLDGRMKKYWLPWLVGMPGETAQAICCILMGGVLEKYPKLRLCFAHGVIFDELYGRVSHGFNVRPDLCATDCSINPSTYNGRFYTDSLVHSPDALDLLLKVVGEDKVVLGTDYPFPLGDLKSGKFIEDHSLYQKLKDKIFWNNGLELLKLPEANFL